MHADAAEVSGSLVAAFVAGWVCCLLFVAWRDAGMVLVEGDSEDG